VLNFPIACLRSDEQELLRLWAWEDLTPAEIAVVLGITPNAVSIRLHRARGRLADVLADDRTFSDAHARKTPPASGHELHERGGTQ